MRRVSVSVKAMLLLGLLGFSFAGVWANAAGEAPSADVIARGRELFNKKEGLNTKFACILCHQKDKAIKKVDVEKAGDKLPAVINKYLVEKAKGKALAPDSPDMQALAAYIRYEHSK